MTTPSPDPKKTAPPPPEPEEQPTQAHTPGGRDGRNTGPAEDLGSDPALHGCSTVSVDGRRTPAVGRIALLRRLGRGGMGVVYYGVHPRLHMEVAVKVLPRGSEFKDDGLVDRFVREARLAARVRSEHLVSVIDVDRDTDSGVNYLVMEYVHGMSAGDHLRRTIREERRQIAEADALDTCIAATRGLQAAHLEGIVHRDVKPDNILIPRDADGRLHFGLAKLADLGLARTDDGSGGITQTQATLGTPGYMAPEQVTDARRAKKAADVFSMGATLYALLTGASPFSGSTSMESILRTLEGKYAHPRSLRAAISDGSVAIISKCLERDAARRFADASALLSALSLARTALDAAGMRMPDVTAEIDVIAKQSEKGKRVVTDAGVEIDDVPAVSVSVTLGPQAPGPAGVAHGPADYGVPARAKSALSRRSATIAGGAGGVLVLGLATWAMLRPDSESPARRDIPGVVRAGTAVPSGSVAPPEVGAAEPRQTASAAPPDPVPEVPPGVTVARPAAQAVAARARRVRFDTTPGLVVRAGTAVLHPDSELPQGTTTITMERPRHSPQQFGVDPDARDDVVLAPRDWRDFRAALDFGGVHGTAGIIVFVDGTPIDEPVQHFPEGGVHRVEIVRNATERAEFRAEARLGPDDWRPPRVIDWQPIRGTVELPVMEGVSWFLDDGRPVRSGEELPVGSHTFVLKRDRHTDGAGCVVVQDGRIARATVTVEPQRVRVSAAAALAALSSIETWDSLSSEAQRDSAEAIALAHPHLELSGLATFTLAGQSHRIATYRHRPSGLEMSLVPGGPFRHVGGHQVSLAPFLVSRYEVTNADWMRVMGTDAPASRWTGPANPKESISWSDASAFCSTAKLSLPTEAQWEHACRAGSTSTWITGDASRDIALAARHNLDAADPQASTGPVPAGSRPNAFGLFDTMGNVAEWCEDRWSDDTALVPAPRTGLRTPEGVMRCVRGGSAYSGGDLLASSHRQRLAETRAPRDTGLRPVLNLD